MINVLSLHKIANLVIVGGPYAAKDQRKLDLATHYVACGSSASSSRKYWDQLCGRDRPCVVDIDRVGRTKYEADTALYVSVEGNRRGRVSYTSSTQAWQAVERFLGQGNVVIADNEYDRRRPYNVGERELLEHLLSLDAVEFKPGMWHVRPALLKQDVEYVRSLISSYRCGDPTDGFCAYAEKRSFEDRDGEDITELFAWAMHEWPKAASLLFPVPHPEHVTLNKFTGASHINACCAYSRAEYMLRNEYGTLRREMLDFMHERLGLGLAEM